MTVVGTRPEIIRLSRIIPLLDEYFDHKLIHTGQNFTRSLSDIFFEELDLRSPDILLNISHDSLGASLGDLFTKIEKEFIAFQPEAVVILGDTNSALTSIIARRMNIAVYHLEAGNRSFDSNVPEEINRRIVDHTSDFNLVYSEHARRNLLAEGLHPRFVGLIGSPLNEIISHYRDKIETSRALNDYGLVEENYFLVSVHRQENVDTPERLKAVASMLNELGENYESPILFSLHPRTRSKLESYGISLHPNVRCVEPLGFFDFCKLQIHSRLVISDSGSISEEAAIMGIRAITLRNSMERPEALEVGNVIMSGVGRSDFGVLVRSALELPIASKLPDDYLITDTSQRVVKFIISTISEHKFWVNIR
jgi:UDP-N-acetylglucosamine 2-epimerase (non-hydrolysing)